MKKSFLFLSIPILVATFLSFSFTNIEETKAEEVASVRWYTWEEAIELNKRNPKKIFIDVYTDWCGWCKRMDKNTFEKKEVADYLNKYFYPVKMDAEMKRKIQYQGHTFEYISNGRRGYHTLAASLLNNRLSFPSCVAMDEKVDRITIIPGYREAGPMMMILRFLKEEKYKTMTFEQYEKSLKGKG